MVNTGWLAVCSIFAMEFAIMSNHAEKWGLGSAVARKISPLTKKAGAYLEYLGKHDVLTQLRNTLFYTRAGTGCRARAWPLSMLP